MAEPAPGGAPAAVEAVIFDWGGTLTPWRTIDPAAEAEALGRAAVEAHPEAHLHLHRATQRIWARVKESQASATLADIFAEAGLVHDEGRLTAYREFWEPHTLLDPDVPELLTRLREDGLRVGVLSNTVWPRAWHEAYFERDGVLHLLDGAVYSSEVPWTKPSPLIFRAAMAAVGASDPARCVFVGDRLYDDVWGAGQVGMRTIHVPHSEVPLEQRGEVEGVPDAVVQRLSEVHDVVRRWR